MKKLVVFDLDGTLIDSEDFIVWSFVEAGRLVGVGVDPELVRESIGLPLEVVVERVLKSAGASESVVEEFLEVRRKIARENWRRMVRLFPDVKPALEELRGMGFKLAVASSAVTERIVEFLEYFGVLGYFSVVLGVGPGVRGKPEPDVLLRVLEASNTSSQEAVYAGDREVDCVAAQRAGVDFVLVDRKRRGTSSWSCTPRITVESLLELPRVLKRL